LVGIGLVGMKRGERVGIVEAKKRERARRVRTGEYPYFIMYLDENLVWKVKQPWTLAKTNEWNVKDPVKPRTTKNIPLKPIKKETPTQTGWNLWTSKTINL
jgi:hypothetical protein